MKKYFCALIAFFAVTFCSFAQIYQDDRNIWYSDIRIGGYFDYEGALGTASEFTYCALNLGVSGEIEIPLTIPDSWPEALYFLGNFGLSAHVDGGYNPVKTDLLTSIWNVRAYIGAFNRINFYFTGWPEWMKGINIQPEIGYGMMAVFPKANPAHSNKLSAGYVDQLIHFSCGLRYSSENILDDCIEFELTPVFTLCPEKNDVLDFVGFRIGALYKIY